MGLVVALALAALIAFALWLTAGSRSSGRQYDIVLDRSVSGLLVGSPVTFSGVPVGRVASIDLIDGQPGRVRVRIDITDSDLPITEGVVAHLDGDLLFGTALVSLEQKDRSGAPLTAPEGEVPVIPVEASGLANLASDPTPMVESIAAATEKLMAVTTPEEQRRITERLAALERETAQMAQEAPALAQRVAEARAALRTGSQVSAQWAEKAADTRRNLDASSAARTRDLRASLAAAREATAALDARVQASRAGIASTSESAADLQQKITAARRAVAELSAKVQEIDRGSAPLLSDPPTPEYEPKKR